MDIYSKKKRSLIMSRVRSKNTKPEKLLFKLLREKGYRFKKHHQIPGRPDIAFPDLKIAVFIDGEFWHGRDFNDWKNKLSPFWLKKIGDNIRRDKKNLKILKKRGWHILRFWDKEVLRNPEKALSKISKFVDKMRTS